MKFNLTNIVQIFFIKNLEYNAEYKLLPAKIGMCNLKYTYSLPNTIYIHY